MDVNDRLTRLEDALIDLTVVVTEGHIDGLRTHIAAEVGEAGGRLEAFYREVINERSQ